MTSRALIAVVLASSLFGARPALALESDAADTLTVSLAHAAVAAASAAPAPADDVQRLLYGVPATDESPSSCAVPRPVHVAPTVFAARPDVATCPARGPP